MAATQPRCRVAMITAPVGDADSERVVHHLEGWQELRGSPTADGSKPASTCSPSTGSRSTAGSARPGRQDGVVRRYVWIKDDPPGMEQATIDVAPDGLRASAVAFGSVPVPYRLDLELTVGADWVTRRLALTAVGDGWTRALLLARGEQGRWTGQRSADGTEPPEVGESEPADVVEPDAIPSSVVDVDVQWSPVTNVMPVRRLGLDRVGAASTFTMAWVSVPSLAVTLDEQRYTLLGRDDGDVCARFESGDGFFTAVLRCDDDGIVVEYPGIARRVS